MPATTADELYTRLLKVAEEEKIILHNAIKGNGWQSASTTN
jgi:hypothetical protein